MKAIREKGVVQRIDADGAVIVVEPIDKKSCGSCCACGGGANPVLRIADSGRLAEGDEVILEVITPSRVVSALLIFVLPLGGLLGGYLVARGLLALLGVASGPTANRITGIASVAGFIASFFIAAWYDRRWRARHADPVKIVEVKRDRA